MRYLLVGGPIIKQLNLVGCGLEVSWQCSVSSGTLQHFIYRCSGNFRDRSTAGAEQTCVEPDLPVSGVLSVPPNTSEAPVHVLIGAAPTSRATSMLGPRP